jgi:hypothetical protein
VHGVRDRIVVHDSGKGKGGGGDGMKRGGGGKGWGKWSIDETRYDEDGGAVAYEEQRDSLALAHIRHRWPSTGLRAPFRQKIRWEREKKQGRGDAASWYCTFMKSGP